jgi:ferredoxin-NADP reductase
MAITQTVLREFEADLIVERTEPVTADVVALTLRRCDGGDLPEWTPGAHIDLVLEGGLVRQYSLCGQPQDAGAYRIAVLKTPDSRGGSRAVHAFRPGQKARVRGPRNHFPIVPAHSYLLVAGGIGITPLLPMIRQIEAVGAQWELWYGGRTRSSMAFLGELEELGAFGDRVHVVPEDTDGRPDLTAILKEPRPGTLVYACGPEGLLAAMEAGCAHWPPGSLHLERFSAKQQGVEAIGHSFELVLQRSGLTLTVPAGQSIFDTVRQAGVSVLGSCLEGICGTCETEVVEGEIDHRDSVLDGEERAGNEVMMICVSRCSGARLALDL